MTTDQEREDLAHRGHGHWYTLAREGAERHYGAEFRRLCWGSMIYACAGPSGGAPGCGWEHRVVLGVGVEGPPALKEAKCIIPCPFFCGGCPDCRGRLHHDRWNEDEEWEPREIADGEAYFYVPSARRARKNAEVNYGGAEYKDPTGRTI